MDLLIQAALQGQMLLYSAGQQIPFKRLPFCRWSCQCDIFHKHSITAHCSGLEDCIFFNPLACVSLELSRCQVIFFPSQK